MRGIETQDQEEDDIADNGDGEGVGDDDDIHNSDDHHDDDTPHDDGEDNEDMRAHDCEDDDVYDDGAT